MGGTILRGRRRTWSGWNDTAMWTAIGALVLAATAASAKGSGAHMCVLRPADFRAAGVTVEAAPTINLDQNGENAYCVYRGKSGATGGVELDVFFPAGSSPEDVEQTFMTVMNSDPGARYEPAPLAGADRAMVAPAIPQSGHPPFAAVAVRRGDLVFSISLPASPAAKTQLLRLSEVVLGRL